MTKVVAALLVLGIGFTVQTNWELKKDKDGIKVYTSGADDSKFKQFKAMSCQFPKEKQEEAAAWASRSLQCRVSAA